VRSFSIDERTSFMQRLLHVLVAGSVMLVIAAAFAASGPSPVSAGVPLCVTATPPGGATDTPTNTPTDTPTNTPTNTPTDTPTNTPTTTPTATATATATDTPPSTNLSVQRTGRLASVGGPGINVQSSARFIQIAVPTCTPTPTDTPVDTATAVDTATTVDTATSTSEPSVTATLGGATDVPASETPPVQLPNTGSGSGSSNPFAVMAVLLLAACGAIWAIGRPARKA
jgi:LPXTG-motif cell wall-anchored protein